MKMVFSVELLRWYWLVIQIFETPETRGRPASVRVRRVALTLPKRSPPRSHASSSRSRKPTPSASYSLGLFFSSLCLPHPWPPRAAAAALLLLCSHHRSLLLPSRCILEPSPTLVAAGRHSRPTGLGAAGRCQPPPWTGSKALSCH
jgi:hypothetical protein